ncbi:MAG: isoleucine--tRNA ligase [Alphaproteobacteria bacterium]|nr:isoleucine--tRNA ligase [Alphaproteobacteria bacterium]
MPDASDRDAPAPRDYKETLFLPATDFPMRAGLPKAEPEILKRWEKLDLYKRLREDAKGRKKYILHDGPPYANGHVHLGTALTKVLKDLVVRSRQMTGFDANYVPGWDCHGLPIEWKVEEEFRAKGRAKRDVPSSEFRARCREYAQEWLDIQREEFKRLGVTGDWDNPYTTMAFDAEAVIAAELLKFADAGLLYRGSKPVMWSPVEQTALAEAEIEYHDHVSTTIWVKFPVQPHEGVRSDEKAVREFNGASIVIWTTTPWTIPGNRAICYGPRLSYGVYEVTALDKIVDPKTGEEIAPWAKVGDKLIVADNLWASVAAAAKIADAKRLGDVNPAGLVCDHPLKGFGGGYQFQVPLLAGDHVTDEDGTGFVHTAPGHGQEDYIAWMGAEAKPWREALVKLEGAEIPHTVDEFGAFTKEAPGFEGRHVLVLEGKKKGQDGDANKAVIDALIEKGALLARGRLTHSYPHSWRSKAPVIFRNTPQWFIALDRKMANGKTLRETALAAIDATGFTPPQARNRIRSMVETRPDWLVSRQRAWGVPLTIFVDKETGEILRDKAVDKRVIDLIRKGGADAWFDTDAAEILGPAYDAARYEKVTDILDVWFDSGSTHAFVLEGRDDLSWPADVYCEGSDQHRGWFQSSLLESCGTRGRAPYRHIITNGFVVDADGRKMSKSLGNVVAPEAINEKFGAEITRIWIASGDYTEDPRIGPEIINSAVDAYRKLRNTIRYLLGALSGFSENELVGEDDMPSLERYILHRLAELDAGVREGYENFDFKSVWRRVFDFCALDLSAFYLDIRKDSLYCDRPDDMRRRSARTVMHRCFERLTAWLAPILVFTMEEAWRSLYPDEESVHLRQFPETPASWRNEKLAAEWANLRKVRRVVTGALEVERREKRIGASLEAAPVVYIEDANLRALCENHDLAELFITGAVTLTDGAGPAGAFRLDEAPGVAVEPAASQDRKCARCWRYTDDVGADAIHADLCARCADAVAAHDAGAGKVV